MSEPQEVKTTQDVAKLVEPGHERVDYRSLPKAQRLKIRRGWEKEYAAQMRKLGLPDGRLQTRTLFDRAVSEGKLLVTRPKQP